MQLEYNHQTFGKIEAEFRHFKEDLCKTLEAVEQRFDSKLSAVAPKTDWLDAGQKEFNQMAEKIKGQLVNLENKTTKLYKAFLLLEDEFKQLEDDLNNLHRVTEDVDNNLWKNNPKLKGLKEGAEYGNLKEYMENLFIVCLVSESNAEVKLKFTYQLGNYGRGRKRNKDKICYLDFLIGNP